MPRGYIVQCKRRETYLEARYECQKLGWFYMISILSKRRIIPGIDKVNVTGKIYNFSHLFLADPIELWGS